MRAGSKYEGLYTEVRQELDVLTAIGDNIRNEVAALRKQFDGLAADVARQDNARQDTDHLSQQQEARTVTMSCYKRRRDSKLDETSIWPGSPEKTRKSPVNILDISNIPNVTACSTRMHYSDCSLDDMDYDGTTEASPAALRPAKSRRLSLQYAQCIQAALFTDNTRQETMTTPVQRNRSTARVRSSARTPQQQENSERYISSSRKTSSRPRTDWMGNVFQVERDSSACDSTSSGVSSGLSNSLESLTPAMGHTSQVRRSNRVPYYSDYRRPSSEENLLTQHRPACVGQEASLCVSRVTMETSDQLSDSSGCSTCCQNYSTSTKYSVLCSTQVPGMSFYNQQPQNPVGQRSPMSPGSDATSFMDRAELCRRGVVAGQMQPSRRRVIAKKLKKARKIFSQQGPNKPHMPTLAVL